MQKSQATGECKFRDGILRHDESLADVEQGMLEYLQNKSRKTWPTDNKICFIDRISRLARFLEPE